MKFVMVYWFCSFTKREKEKTKTTTPIATGRKSLPEIGNSWIHQRQTKIRDERSNSGKRGIG